MTSRTRGSRPRPAASLPEDGRWRRGVVLLGIVSAAALLPGMVAELGDPLATGLLGVGLALWLLELLATPTTLWVEAAVLLGVGVCGGVLNAVAIDSSGFLLCYLAAAALGLRLPLRQGVAVLLLVLAVLDAGVLLASPHPVTSVTTDDLGVAFTFVVAMSAANARRAHARSEALLLELEATRASEAEAAALAERARLAREIHDILAHALSGQVMSLEATRMLAERTGADPRVVTEVTRAHRLAKSGLADTRRAIGALRGDTLPGPDLLPRLVEEAGATHGIRATLSVHGAPRPVPADVGLTLYRTAQEALTNTAKHAGRGACAELTLTWGEDAVSLAARDVRRDATPAPLPSGGYGITGLRERAELAGGTLTARATDDGFELCLTLPYEHVRTLR